MMLATEILELRERVIAYLSTCWEVCLCVRCEKNQSVAGSRIKNGQGFFSRPAMQVVQKTNTLFNTSGEDERKNHHRTVVTNVVGSQVSGGRLRTLWAM